MGAIQSVTVTVASVVIAVVVVVTLLDAMASEPGKSISLHCTFYGSSKESHLG